MSRKIFLVTPGEQKKDVGVLKKRGAKQARFAGKVLVRNGFDEENGLIITSPRIADEQTAKIIHKKTKSKEKVIVSDRVYEHTNHSSTLGQTALVGSVAEALISIPATQPNEVPVAIVMCPERIALEVDVDTDKIAPGSVYEFNYDPKVRPKLLDLAPKK